VDRSVYPLVSDHRCCVASLRLFLWSPLLSLRRSLVVSGLLSVALVVGVVSPAYAGGPVPPSGPSNTPSAPVVPLPVPKSNTAAPASGAGSTGPTANLFTTSAPAQKLVAPGGKSFSAVTSVPISYSADETTFRNADGSQTKEISPTPINVKNANGTWAAASTALSVGASGQGFAVANNPLSPTFAAASGAGPELSVNSGSSPVSVSLVGAAASAAVRPSAADLHSGVCNFLCVIGFRLVES
jgi:hypothetical protein